MKTKFKLSCLFLAALMLFSLTACGKDNPEPSSTSEGTEQTKPPVEAGSGTTIHTNLWDLTYDEADGWVYEEDDLHDDETSSKIILTLPKEGEDGSIVDAEIRVSVEDPYTFRDYLTSYGFDEYEYAVDQAYDLTPVGGIDCLKAEGNYWGSPCLRYMNRVEGAGATVFMEIIGEYEDERVDKLLSGLTIHLEDTGNEDGPWYWEGEPDEDNRQMTSMYRAEINKIKGDHFDVAFVPLDPRQESHYADGMIYFLDNIDCKNVYPNHYWKKPHKITRFITEYPQYPSRIRKTELAKGEEQ